MSQPHTFRMSVLGRVFWDRLVQQPHFIVEEIEAQRAEVICLWPASQPLCGRARTRIFQTIPHLWGLLQGLRKACHPSWASIARDIHKEVTKKNHRITWAHLNIMTLQTQEEQTWKQVTRNRSAVLTQTWFQMIHKLHNKSGSRAKNETVWDSLYSAGWVCQYLAYRSQWLHLAKKSWDNGPTARAVTRNG